MNIKIICFLFSVLILALLIYIYKGVKNENILKLKFYVLKGFYVKYFISLIAGWFTFLYTDEFWRLNMKPVSNIAFLIVLNFATFLILFSIIYVELEEYRLVVVFRRAFVLFLIIFFYSLIIGVIVLNLGIKEDYIISTDLLKENHLIGEEVNNRSKNKFPFSQSEDINQRLKEIKEYQECFDYNKIYKFLKNKLKLNILFNVNKDYEFLLYIVLINGIFWGMFYGTFFNILINKFL